MKIGINTFGCDHGRSGIGSYIRSFIKNLPKTDCEIELFGSELDKYTYTSDVDYAKFVSADIADTTAAEKLWHFKNLNFFIKKQKYDMVLYPSGVTLLPPIFTVPSILVIQSLLSTDLNLFSRLGLKYSLNKATALISPTKYIKNDLERCGVPSEKIKVIYNGIDTSVFTPKNETKDSSLMQPFSIKKPYIIYASRITHEAKCHVELINGFTLFKKKYGTAHRLVIAGSDGNNSQAVHKAVIQSGYSQDILLTGYFPHERLPHLYSSADLCIFPSTIEGVGLPVIEAMSCAIPVACANYGALPEIAGSAALFFNPKNIEEIAESIYALIDIEANTSRRDEMINKGLIWVKKYDWKQTAKETMNFLKGKHFSYQ